MATAKRTKTPKRTGERPGVVRVTASVDKRLAELAHEHHLGPSVALTRGWAEQLVDRGVAIPPNLKLGK